DVGKTYGRAFSKVSTKKQIFNELSRELELEPIDPDYIGEVSKRSRYIGTDTEVRFITAASGSFCSTCTRARIAADGKLYTCLFASKGFDFKELLRSGVNDDEVIKQIIALWNNRTDRYSDERTEESAKNKDRIEMSYIGG